LIDVILVEFTEVRLERYQRESASFGLGLESLDYEVGKSVLIHELLDVIQRLVFDFLKSQLEDGS